MGREILAEVSTAQSDRLWGFTEQVQLSKITANPHFRAESNRENFYPQKFSITLNS